MFNEEQRITEVISSLFEGADEHNWEKVMQVMAGEVLLEYTSMIGGSHPCLRPNRSG